MISEKSCGAVVFTRDGGTVKYVLIKQLNGTVGFPKGHMEGSETEYETAQREIFEETGLTPTILEGFKFRDEFILPNGKAKEVIYFLSEYENQEIKIQEEEIECSLLLPFAEALEQITYDSTRDILRKANAFLN